MSGARTRRGPLTVRELSRVARSLNVEISARATHRVSVPSSREISTPIGARDAVDWQLVRGVEYVLTGGSSYGRDTVAELMAAALPGAVIVHVSPFTFVRTVSSARGTCVHCGRDVVSVNGRWIDTRATGDDSVWRETCDSHDTFTAEHEVAV